MRFYNILLVAILLSLTVMARGEMSQSVGQSSTKSRLIGNYANATFQMFAGYVNKSWVCSYEGEGTQREDFYGDPNDQFLHGWQIGMLYTPAFDWGLGLRTGLAFEWYISRSQWIRDWSTRFSELDLNIPLHAMYRYTKSADFGFEIFAGVAFQLAMAGLYYQYYENAAALAWSGYYTYRPCGPATKTQHYGDGWPQRVNWQADIGATFRYQMVALSFTYSFGLNDHELQTSFNEGRSFVTATKSRQDKMQATLTFFF